MHLTALGSELEGKQLHVSFQMLPYVYFFSVNILSSSIIIINSLRRKTMPYISL